MLLNKAPSKQTLLYDIFLIKKLARGPEKVIFETNFYVVNIDQKVIIYRVRGTLKVNTYKIKYLSFLS